MTYTDYKYIANQIISLPAIYWTVRHTETGVKYLGRQEENIAPEESANRLKLLLDSLSSGAVIVKISTRPPNELNDSQDKYTGVYTYNVRATPKTYEAPKLETVSNMNLGPTVELQKFLDQVQLNNELKLKIHSLTIELEELKNSKQGQISEMLTPVLMKLAENPQGAIAAIGSIFKGTSKNTDNE